MAAANLIRHSASHVLATDFHYIAGLVERNYVGQGALCEDLRQLIKEQFACSEVILTDSGTAALHLCLVALSMERPGRTKVLAGAYACPEVICAILQAGLEPVLADSRADCLNVDMAAVGRLIDETTLAIICTHVAGIPDDYRLAATYGVPVISDCAQAVGSSVDGRDVAIEGLFAILSFGATKMLTAGGGGALLCRSESSGADNREPGAAGIIDRGVSSRRLPDNLRTTYRRPYRRTGRGPVAQACGAGGAQALDRSLV